MSDDGSHHFSNEQGWGMDDADKIPIEEYSHTVIDLENEVNRVMTEVNTNPSLA